MRLNDKINLNVFVVSMISVLLGACSNQPPEHIPVSASESPQTEVVDASDEAVVETSSIEHESTHVAESASAQDSLSEDAHVGENVSEEELELHADDTVFENFEAPTETVALVPLTANRIEWSAPIERSYERITVNLVGPNGVLQKREFEPGESIEWDSELQDGLYRWESVLTPEVDESVRQQMNEVRSQGNLEAEQALIARLRSEGSLPTEEQGNQNRQSGTFTVTNGVIRPTLVDAHKEVVDR